MCIFSHNPADADKRHVVHAVSVRDLAHAGCIPGAAAFGVRCAGDGDTAGEEGKRGGKAAETGIKKLFSTKLEEKRKASLLDLQRGACYNG